MDSTGSGHKCDSFCRFCNALQPGTIPKSRYSKPVKLPFKKMELIGNFVDGMKRFGVPDQENFATVDLYEEQNLLQVLTCLQSAGRKVSGQGSGRGTNCGMALPRMN